MSKLRKSAVLIAGPTASGKSELALSIAEGTSAEGTDAVATGADVISDKSGAVIINADSMQIYDALPILTAQPTARDMARARHELYGFVPPDHSYSVGHWLDDVARVLNEVRASGRLPIIIGGTGLYFSGLLGSLSPIPDIAPEVRAHWRAEAEILDGPALHTKLASVDPVMASRLKPGDVQRIVRALEVYHSTGRSLAEWQKIPGTPLLNFDDVTALVVAPEREELYARCDARFDRMIDDGAVIDEVRALLDLGLNRELDPGLPVCRALGVREITAFLKGEISLEVARTRAKMETRRYGKRQMTWLRRNMIAWKWVDKKFMQKIDRNILSFIDLEC